MVSPWRITSLGPLSLIYQASITPQSFALPLRLNNWWPNLLIILGSDYMLCVVLVCPLGDAIECQALWLSAPSYFSLDLAFSPPVSSITEYIGNEWTGNMEGWRTVLMELRQWNMMVRCVDSALRVPGWLQTPAWWMLAVQPRPGSGLTPSARQGWQWSALFGMP